MPKIAIVSTRPVPQGFNEAVLGLLTIDVELDAYSQRVDITRYVKGENGKEGNTYTQATVIASRIRIVDVQFCKAKESDRHYIRTGDVALDEGLMWEIVRYIESRRKGKSAGGQNAAPAVEIAEEDIPF